MAVNHKERNKRMTTMELDAFKARLIKDICMADTLEDVLRVAHGCSAEPDRPVKPYPAYQPDRTSRVKETMADVEEEVATDLAIPGVPGTPEELEQVIDDFERQLDEGTFRGLTLEEANAQIRQKFSWLK